MIYRVRLHRYPDDSVVITGKQELKSTTKAYHDYVKDVFIEHQNCLGQDIEDAEEAFQDQPFQVVEKWLLKSGYDLKNDFLYRNS